MLFEDWSLTVEAKAKYEAMLEDHEKAGTEKSTDPSKKGFAFRHKSENQVGRTMFLLF